MASDGVEKKVAAPLTPRARIGMINFINTAPLYMVWTRSVRHPEWLVTEATPAILNRLLFAGDLDLGFVSSYEYAAHPEQYRILSDLSISTTGAVGSVLLFANRPIESLDYELVLLSSQSQTSVSLVKIILEEFYKLRPRYVSGLPAEYKGGEQPAAILAIGDEALRLRKAGLFQYQFDLGQIWRQHTGKPFVFAVWAVREDFCWREPDCVVQIHQELLRCVQQGVTELASISREVAARIPMPPEECLAYLKGIEFDLGLPKQEALVLFFEYLIKRGEGAPGTLPLKICG